MALASTWAAAQKKQAVTCCRPVVSGQMAEMGSGGNL